jgi:hypothetical protein
VLANGLTALLISDPEMADAVAAADGQDGDARGDGSDSEEVGSHTATYITSWDGCGERARYEDVGAHAHGA